MAFYIRYITRYQKVIQQKKRTAKYRQIFKRISNYIIMSTIKTYTDHKNIPCRFWNINIVLICRLILEENGMKIEIFEGKKK